MPSKKKNNKKAKKGASKAAGGSQGPVRGDPAEANSAEDTTLVILNSPRFVMADVRLGPRISPHFLYLPPDSRDCVFVASAPALLSTMMRGIWDGPPLQSRTPSYRLSNAEGKGLGLFAQRPISRGELILEERPVFVGSQPRAIMADQADSGALDSNAVRGLSQKSREAIMALHNAFPEDEPCALSGILRTNCLAIDVTPHSVRDPPPSLLGCFPTLSRANHSCCPSANYYSPPSSFIVQLFATRHIAKGEEITIAYCNPCRPALERQSLLRHTEGFTCKCDVCLLPSGLQTRSDERRSRLRALLEKESLSRAEADEAVRLAEAEQLWVEKAHTLVRRCEFLTDEPSTSPMMLARALKEARDAYVAVEGERSQNADVCEELILTVQLGMLGIHM